MLQLDNAVIRFNNLILNDLKKLNVKCWIAGGAVRDYFSGKAVKTDYDLFFPNEKAYNEVKKYFEENKCEVKWESDNGMKIIYKNNTYDLVKKFFPTPQATIDAFDFTISMFAVDYDNVYYGETSFIDLAKRQLMINKITYPASTLKRVFRYQKKGFDICIGEIKKIYDSIKDTPTTEKEDNKDISNDNLSSGDLLELFGGID